jgi:uncharacterized membrane protein
MSIKEASLLLADRIAAFIGSWTFIILHTIVMIVWVVVNVIGICHFDQYPFILLTLILSLEAAYATPLILMSANRQAERDRVHMITGLELEKEDHVIISELRTIINDVHKDLKIDHMLLKQHEIAAHERNELKELLIDIKDKLN